MRIRNYITPVLAVGAAAIAITAAPTAQADPVSAPPAAIATATVAAPVGSASHGGGFHSGGFRGDPGIWNHGGHRGSDRGQDGDCGQPRTGAVCGPSLY